MKASFKKTVSTINHLCKVVKLVALKAKNQFWNGNRYRFCKICDNGDFQKRISERLIFQKLDQQLKIWWIRSLDIIYFSNFDWNYCDGYGLRSNWTTINLTIFNIICWFGVLGQMTHQPNVWCSKYFFFFIISCKILCKNPFNLFIFYFFINLQK